MSAAACSPPKNIQLRGQYFPNTLRDCFEMMGKPDIDENRRWKCLSVSLREISLASGIDLDLPICPSPTAEPKSKLWQFWKLL